MDGFDEQSVFALPPASARMNRLQEEFLFLVRTSFQSRHTPSEALAILKRHLAFRSEGEATSEPPHLRLLRTGSD